MAAGAGFSNVIHSDKAEWRRDRILDMRHPDKGIAGQDSGCESSG